MVQCDRPAGEAFDGFARNGVLQRTPAYG